MHWISWRRALAVVALLLGVGMGASTVPAAADTVSSDTVSSTTVGTDSFSADSLSSDGATTTAQDWWWN